MMMTRMVNLRVEAARGKRRTRGVDYDEQRQEHIHITFWPTGKNRPASNKQAKMGGIITTEKRAFVAIDLQEH